jgi:hypothetical protein
VLAPAASANAAFPAGENGKIAFEQLDQPANPGGCTYYVKPDGTGRHQLTFCGTGAVERSPTWSADGNRLAFSSFSEIEFWDVGNYTQHVYTDQSGGILGLGWSPDGQRIVATNDSIPSQLYTVKSDATGDFRLLTQRNDVVLSHPAWSPDGTKIVFEGGGVLYTIKPDGTGLTPLPVLGFNPSWSPDGSKIAYDNGDSVFVANADGTGQTLLASSSGLDIEPAWSPDGTKIAFASSRNDSPSCNPDPDTCSFDIYAMNADSTSQTRLTSDAHSERTPDWQPIINYARPKGASPVLASLVPAFKACTAANSTHGAPLSYGSCRPPQQASDFLTVGTPDANGQRANARGFVRLRVTECPTCTPTPTADVLIDASITDVRNKSDLSDYTGLLQAVAPLRITDKNNGLPVSAATVQDTDFPIAVPCTATADPTVGSTCSVSTSANAVMPPGVVSAGGRELWELGQVKVYDGGSAGYDGAPDATLFMEQGLFVP